MEDKILRHGAYLFLRLHVSKRAIAIPQLAQRYGLTNEFEADGRHPDRAIAFLRKVEAMAGNIDDRSLSHADAVVHVAAECADIVRAFCVEASEMFGPNVRIRSGVVRPTLYTGGAMQQFAYENQVRQQSGNTMPHVFLVPMCKTSEWWAKDWMERHTYFLPRYNWRGAKLKDGHALAAAPGIPHLYRRTYKHQVMPAPQGEYDFLNYFECADSGVPIFHEVCAALRDQRRNPEWHFVREGPTWRGHRASTWAELFD